ncbi:mitogen-activated protein kinase kinase kinase 20-like [Malania oleifera]|uniref:mitogen-activated protein kinase kinase kinase 20-like n=1 Tax=Malania oleifera TaxID=397392 RepID=UPI0025ADEB75|nr:mitogen-activated protein kinase kinase kinase 20-like [Malania oleifera]
MKRNRGDAAEEFDYGDGVSWVRGPLIGKGSHGCVFLANPRKKMKKGGCFPSVMAVKSSEVSLSATLQKEKETLCNLQGCSSVLQCFGDEETYSEDGQQMIYNLLLEYAPGGTLGALIKKHTAVAALIPQSDVRAYARALLRGLRHIHARGYVHCDLKPDNILLFLPNSGSAVAKFVPKIADFGLAKRTSKQGPCFRGTPLYMSPEAVVRGTQGPPSDVWALGCVVLEMLTGRPPWDGAAFLDREGLLSRIRTPNQLPKVPSTLSKEASDFLKKCFVRKAPFRSTAEKLLTHPFVAELDCKDDEPETNGFEEEEEEEGEEEEEEVIYPVEGLSETVTETDDEYSSFSSDDQSYSSEDFFSSSVSEEVVFPILPGKK